MADFAVPTTNGGNKTNVVAAGSGAADVVVAAVPGRISKVHITTAGTALIVLYDHATATSGAKIVWKSPATTVLGVTYDLDIPVTNGITALQANGSPAVTISYSEDGLGNVNKGRSQLTSSGGQATSYHAAGAGGASAALSGPGRMCKVVVLAQGTVATSIYDAASAAGTKLLSIPASGTTAVTAGTVVDIQAPCATGIYVGGAANTSELLVCYATDTAFGR